MARYKKNTSGMDALMNVTSLWEEYGARVRGEGEEKRQFGIKRQQFRVQEGRRQRTAASQAEQAKQTQTLRVWDRFIGLWEAAGKDPALRDHYSKLLEGLYGAVGPRDKEMLKPYLAKGPLDPTQRKERFFRNKMGKRPAPAQLKEGETEDSPGYRQRWAETFFAGKKYDWLKKKYMGIEPGKFPESYAIGAVDGVTQYAVKKKDTPAYMTDAKAYKWDRIETEFGYLPGTIERSDGRVQVSSTVKSIGSEVYEVRKYQNFKEGTIEVDAELRPDIEGGQRVAKAKLKKASQAYKDFKGAFIAEVDPEGKDFPFKPGNNNGKLFYNRLWEDSKAVLEAGYSEGEWNDWMQDQLQTVQRGWVYALKYGGVPTEDKPFGENPSILEAPGHLAYTENPKKGEKGQEPYLGFILDPETGAVYYYNSFEYAGQREDVEKNLGFKLQRAQTKGFEVLE